MNSAACLPATKWLPLFNAIVLRVDGQVLAVTSSWLT
jgi:hypothetical protein